QWRLAFEYSQCLRAQFRLGAHHRFGGKVGDEDTGERHGKAVLSSQRAISYQLSALSTKGKVVTTNRRNFCNAGVAPWLAISAGRARLSTVPKDAWLQGGFGR